MHTSFRPADIGNKEMTKEATRNPCWEHSQQSTQEYGAQWKNGIKRFKTSGYRISAVLFNERFPINFGFPKYIS